MTKIPTLLVVVSIALLSRQGISQEATLQQELIAKQETIGAMGCGPCAVVNSLSLAKHPALQQLSGTTQLEKVHSFIDRFAAADSVIYGKNRKAYSTEKGAADRDLKFLLSELFKANGLKAVNGRYAVRDKSASESQAAFVSRSHELLSESVKGGFHPIVSVRAIAAEFDKQRDRHLWNSKGGHFIVVHKVGELREGSLSFPILISDSVSGRLLNAFVYLDPTRNTSVPMGFTADENGKEVWEWERGSDTLAVLCPEMPLGTRRAMWYERTSIAVRYLITK